MRARLGLVLFWGGLSALLLSSCKQGAVEKTNVEVIDLRRDAAELRLEKSVFSRIEHLVDPEEAEAHAESHEADSGHGASAEDGHGGGGKASVGKTRTMDYAELVVYLSSPHARTIRGEALRLEFPKGGGTVDLGKYVNRNSNEDFFFGVEVGSSVSILGKTKVYFVGGAKPQTLGATVYGQKCGQAADVTRFFQTHLSRNGIRVSAARGLYVSQLVGHFVFLVQGLDGSWKGAQLTVTDSQRPELTCPVEA